MTDFKSIFSKDVEVPEIVKQKAETAFRTINMEGSVNMLNLKTYDKIEKKRKKRRFKTQVVAAACICLIAAGSITSIAAIRHFWSRGIQGTVQATDGQKQGLTDQGVASVFSELEGYADMAVTNGNVTVVPEMVIIDDKFAFISFSVKGYTLEKDVEPGFEHVTIYLGNDPSREEDWVNMNASFYDGIISDENGSLMYDDGTPLEFGENGKLMSRYADKDGTLEFVVQVSVSDYAKSLLGKTLHVNFENLGKVHKGKYTEAQKGKWDFTMNLSDVGSTTKINVGKSVPGTNFVLDSIDISPISIKMNYSVNGKVVINEDRNAVPEFCGVKLKDGTKFPYISNGGMTGYTDNSMSSAYALSAFDRVIASDQVASLLVRTESSGADMIEIQIH